MSTRMSKDNQINLLSNGLTGQLEVNTNLTFFLNEAEHNRDKALFYLLQFCELSKREGWALSAEAEEMRERAENVLFDNNIYTGLPEPDHAILRLLQAVAYDEGVE